MEQTAFQPDKSASVHRFFPEFPAPVSDPPYGKPFVPYIKAAMQEEGILTTPKASFPFPEVTEEDRVRIRSILPEGHLDAE